MMPGAWGRRNSLPSEELTLVSGLASESLGKMAAQFTVLIKNNIHFPRFGFSKYGSAVTSEWLCPPWSHTNRPPRGRVNRLCRSGTEPGRGGGNENTAHGHRGETLPGGCSGGV